MGRIVLLLFSLTAPVFFFLSRRVQKQWKGPTQYEDGSKALMMLPTDLVLIKDEKFKEWVVKYAADEALFFKDFSAAYKKLTENGVAAFKKSWWQFW